MWNLSQQISIWCITEPSINSCYQEMACGSFTAWKWKMKAKEHLGCFLSNTASLNLSYLWIYRCFILSQCHMFCRSGKWVYVSLDADKKAITCEFEFVKSFIQEEHLRLKSCFLIQYYNTFCWWKICVKYIQYIIFCYRSCRALEAAV